MSRLVRALLAGALLLALASPASAAPRAPVPLERDHGPLLGLSVPWAAGGPRIMPDGHRVTWPREWPGYPVPAVRLWDTRTAWLNIEPARGRYNFSGLDAQIAAAHAHGTTDITLVLAGTPRWAAGSLDRRDAPWLGPGSASPPQHLADWHDYVTAVATRYRGTLTGYEIGNEVDARMFWRGTRSDLVDLVGTAARAIRAADPAALIAAPSMLGGPGGPDPAAIEKMWAALAAAGTPLDVLTFHYYPWSASYDLAAVTARMRTAASRAGLGALPLWVTETNARATARGHAAAAAERMLASVAASGADRVYVYAWTRPESRRLLALYTGTPADRVLGDALRQAAARPGG